MTYTIHINNCDEIVEREMTAEEIAQRETEIAQWKAKKAAEKLALEEKEAQRVALLEKLGITVEEAKLLLP